MENSFSKVPKFSHIEQSMLLVLLQGCFKKIDVQFKRSVLRNDEEYYTLKVFHPAPEHTVKSQPRRIKCSDQFRVNKRDTDCFEHLQEENTKRSVN